ncbi:toxin-antitoxin system HicB family antitoxin [Vibrio sp. 1151_11]|uniref:toxin-antitoxin system HicB family antitoxin n=1 Tax=Vibrio sp. 1151_11 TaxID=2527670 RepID=UPI0024072A85|nr:toxin-antitoxin system HicB family antitoxin [Vibrio sp. 1151_11]MDF9390843.1 toxin-antitoxin system HicB family antitoxin [Vibrio sp. 1151_11]
MMKNFDPERYTVSVRKEIVEGEELFVARVAELSDVEEYGDTFEEARSLALDTIETAYEMCKEQNIAFPAPSPRYDERELASGRVTLRMPKTLHARLIQEAELEDVSLNQYLVSSLSMNYGQCQLSKSVVEEVKSRFDALQEQINKYQKVAATYLFKEYVDNFKVQESPQWVVKDKREELQWVAS